MEILAEAAVSILTGRYDNDDDVNITKSKTESERGEPK